MIGEYPKYLEVAKTIKAKVFSAPEDVWYSLTSDQQWELKKTFFDQAVARGDFFYLASGWTEATGDYGRELQYLIDLGCKVSKSQLWLIPPGN